MIKIILESYDPKIVSSAKKIALEYIKRANITGQLPPRFYVHAEIFKRFGDKVRSPMDLGSLITFILTKEGQIIERRRKDKILGYLCLNSN